MPTPKPIVAIVIGDDGIYVAANQDIELHILEEIRGKPSMIQGKLHPKLKKVLLETLSPDTITPDPVQFILDNP